MSLAIGVRPGDKIYLNDDPLEVLLMAVGYGKVKFKGEDFVIREDESTKLDSEVRISLGRNGERVSRILFDAPQSVVILREKLYAGKKG